MAEIKDDSEKETWATVILRPTSEFLESLTISKTVQTRYRLIPTEHLNKATRAGLIDMTLGRIGKYTHQPIGAQIIRFDNPHDGLGISKLPHINIDPSGKSNANNPHIAVPASLIACADRLDKCLKAVGKALFIVALVTDGLRICAAIYEDMNSDVNHVLPEETIKTIASIAGEWSGAAVGAYGATILGAQIGACVGSFFGRIGALIGAPIGAIVGSIAGAIAGGFLGSYLAGSGAQAGLDYIDTAATHKQHSRSVDQGSNDGEIINWHTFFVKTFDRIDNPSQLVDDVPGHMKTESEILKSHAYIKPTIRESYMKNAVDEARLIEFCEKAILMNTNFFEAARSIAMNAQNTFCGIWGCFLGVVRPGAFAMDGGRDHVSMYVGDIWVIIFKRC